MRWDPGTYLQFADERARPFLDLLARVDAREPRRVVDLGCGPGTLTQVLADRWPAATVEGIDSSAEMVQRAEGLALPTRVSFMVGDLREWFPTEPVDVVVSNATLQWVPNHLALLPRLLAGVRPGGWLAVQVPGNFGERSHTAIDDLLAQPRWRQRLATVALERPAAEEPATYLATLAPHVARADVWETTYLHLLQGPDAVVRWVSGTGLRPVLSALQEDEREQFVVAYRDLVAPAYPERPWGTVLPFRRIFAVAQR